MKNVERLIYIKNYGALQFVNYLSYNFANFILLFIKFIFIDEMFLKLLKLLAKQSIIKMQFLN